MNQALVNKVSQDTDKILSFCQLLKVALQDKFIKHDLTDDEFAHMINLLTVINHRATEVNFEVKDYIRDYNRKMHIYQPEQIQKIIDRKV